VRALDLRRHSTRDPGGVHLSPAGVALARRVGAGSGPFVRVVSSPIPRAVETAAAIGGGRIEIREELAALGASVDDALGPIVRWSDYAAAVRRSAVVAAFAATQRELLLGIAGSLPDGARGLIVSHGGVVELGAVAALPDAHHDDWRGPASYCEGIRLEHASGRFVRGTLLRVDPAAPSSR
jgi:broad specificity phosphatase PhoE